jgi:uncharacterized membrane protein YphA (DoxX/SURF4 family)
MQSSTKNTLAWVLRIVVSLLFIVSAVAKLSKSEILDSPYFAISTFEVKQLYTLGFSQSIAPYFSRILIGIELALGILLLQKNYLKRFIIPVTILMLGVFIFHLSYLILSNGNSGNCGCFGELIPMTPAESIVKNIVAIGLLVWIYKLLPKETETHNFWVLTTGLFASILSLFMLAPIRPVEDSSFTVSPIEDTFVNDSLAIDSTAIIIDSVKTGKPIESVKKDSVKVEKAIEKVVEEITLDPKKKKSGYAKFYSKIDNGKQLLCFFVPGCDHCQHAAKELTELKNKDKNFPPVSILFMNEEPEKIPEFFSIAGAKYPYKIVEIIPFYDLMGDNKNTPGVKYLWNGNEIKYWFNPEGEHQFHGSELVPLLSKTKEELGLK